MFNTKYFIQDYPRPQLVNKNWKLLDGEWNFAFDDTNVGEEKKWFVHFPSALTIIVPFSYQTKMSTIQEEKEHPYIWYCKKVQYDEELENQRLIFHIEGCDYKTKVWVNGVFIGSHVGGYGRISFDITQAVKEKNGEAFIVVKAEDFKEATQPRGKQTWLDKPFGCWYHETNGIWKSVWSEIVPSTYLLEVKMTPSLLEYNVEFEMVFNQFEKNHEVEIEITFHDQLISKTRIHIVRRITNIKLDMNNDFDGFRLHYWTPESPNLYDVKITVFKDLTIREELGSYFGFRTFRAEKNCLLLNNNPIYLKMVLHQGYYRDSGLSAPNIEALKKDILLAKELGFNGMRMHQKIEDERFYYYADVLGMMVWCEMPSPYEFKDATIDSIVPEWMQIVKQYYNHPSICVWVPLNESWGIPRVMFDSTNQHLAETLYHVTKAYDALRPVISNDGWEQTESDIVTLHNYAQSKEELLHFYENVEDMLQGHNRVDYSQTRLPLANGYVYHGQPIVLSEFAGIGYQNGNDKGWGYGDKVSSDKDYVDRLSSLIEAIRSIDQICGFCITQLTDVEQEINGLLDIDRVHKADIKKLKEAIKK